ncbi:putative uncharacterized protein DDB_G0286901 [Teleopsis dalmanni]|uniref:putative uncharacterized protein DDB_G0286901 n=1 Tax=Teleopsis dalmanni TaxID=139649 RepID=UPI0018CDE4C6|nr:putative uncharacterized protein DDB_G0286901 [Teleopsis dalmanni]
MSILHNPEQDTNKTVVNILQILLKDAPVCGTNAVVVIGASLEEAVPIPCRVNSDPPEIDFEWTFSSSGEHFEVPSGHYATIQEATTTGDIHRTIVEANDTHFETYVETVSELIYTPKGERDYGTLACWGRNSIGKQSEPCLFQVVPAAKPGALRNCTLRPYVVTSASLNSSNQTTMHSNQILPTQYGHHESNFPHMEYVRERHPNNNSINNSKSNSNSNSNSNGNSNSNDNGNIKNDSNSSGNNVRHGTSINNNRKTNNKINNANQQHKKSAATTTTTNTKDYQQQRQQTYLQQPLMNKQQLQRLKKRTSFTPSQTLAAIKKQQLRKQQQKQHNKLNNNQMIVDVSNYNIAVAAPSSSAASSASVAGAGAAAASIVASSSSSVEATLSASTTMSYINNKTDGSSTKARVDNKRRVKRATDEAQKTTYNNTKKSVRISTATATTSTAIRTEKKNKLKHTTKKQKSNLSLSSDRKWQKNKNMATAENILIGNGESNNNNNNNSNSNNTSNSISNRSRSNMVEKYHNNRRKNTHKREVSPTRVIHHYERETETEVDAARIAKRETATAAVVVKHTNATKRTSKHLANAKTSIIAAQYESQQQQHQQHQQHEQHQQHQQYSKPGQHEETLQQQLTTQREFNDFSNKNKNKNKNKDNELRKQRNADNAKKDNLEKIRIRKSLTMQNNMERHTIASKNKNGSNSNNNNVASNIKIPNAPLISNNNNNSNMKGQESQQEHKQRNTKSNELNVANINSAIVNNMQQTINDLNQIEDIVASNIVDSESVNDIFDSNFTNNDEDIDADIDVDADADAEADAEAEAVAETETDMEVENEVEADLDADTETDDDDDDDNGMEDEEIEDDVALLNALDDAATMQSHHQQQQQLLLQQQQQEQYVQEPHFDYSRMEYSFSNGVATHSLIGGNSVDMGEGGSINMENNDNIVYSTMELECMPGYDGGLQQQFFLEAYDSKTKKLRLNTTSTYSDVPIFRIDLSDLTSMDYYPDPNPALHLVVYSVNQKGRSEPIVLENIPINEAEKRTGKHKIDFHQTPKKAKSTRKFIASLQ